MHTPDRTPSSEGHKTPVKPDKNARIFEIGPLMKANRTLAEDMGTTERALKMINSGKVMNMAFHGGRLEDATKFYDEQQRQQSERREQAENRIKELKAEQSIMLDAARLGFNDPTEWLSGEEERIAVAQAENFRTKQQLEMSHTHSRGSEQVISAIKLAELQVEMSGNASKMGAIVRFRNRL